MRARRVKAGHNERNGSEPSVAMRAGLSGGFVDFDFLPRLLERAETTGGRQETVALWSRFLDHVKFIEGHIDPDKFPSGMTAADCMAADAWRFAERMGLIESSGPTADGRETAALAETAQDLEKTTNLWARECPGLIPVEVGAIVYWACVNRRRGEELLDNIVARRGDTPLPGAEPGGRGRRPRTASLRPGFRVLRGAPVARGQGAVVVWGGVCFDHALGRLRFPCGGRPWVACDRFVYEALTGSEIWPEQ